MSQTVDESSTQPSTQLVEFEVEFQTRRRQQGESWAELADNLRLLADKAFPNLEDAAKERLAILGQVPLLARQTATSLSSQAD